jgi:hypothetical protein
MKYEIEGLYWKTKEENVKEKRRNQERSKRETGREI